MPAKELFEYAVIRLVPAIEREEFFNVGVVLYCRSQRVLEMRYLLDPAKMVAFGVAARTEEIDAYLQAFRLICRGEPAGGVIASLPLAERFRWLTAKRSTVVQTSAVHPGLCELAGETLERLFSELVM